MELVSWHGLSHRISNCLSTDGGPYYFRYAGALFHRQREFLEMQGNAAAEREVFDGVRAPFLAILLWAGKEVSFSVV